MLTNWKRPWCWEGLRAGWEGDDRGWDGWTEDEMALPTQWTWVLVDSGSWWWTGRPGVLRFMGSQRVGHDWATELNSKNISRTVSVVVDRVGSVHFPIVPWSSLHFSSTVGPLICNRCYLQGFSLLHLSLPRWFPLFYLLFAGLFSVYFPPWQKGAVVDTLLGSLVQLQPWN